MHKTDMERYSREEQDRFRSYLKVHLKRGQLDLSVSQQIEALGKRARSRRWHLLINIAAILFFGYSFYFNITQLSQTLFIIITIVFGINIGLIFYQRKQIDTLITYLKWKQSNEQP